MQLARKKIRCGARFALAMLATSLFCSAGAGADGELADAFGRGSLIIAADEYACYRFDVYLATDDAQRGRGLMFVRELPPMTGMLFVYEADGYLSMWMRNTLIPLDMLFVRADGTVAGVAADTVPLSEKSVVAPEPVRYVLELNAGTAARLRIGTDSRLLLEAGPLAAD